MFTHQVLIIRPDTSNDFYYTKTGVLDDPYYVSLAAQAKADGKMLSEELKISEDQLILDRTVHWDSEASFNEFLDLWIAHDPNHRTEFQNYSKSVDHIAMLVV